MLFFRPNTVSQPFWQTLRSISLLGYSGFLLVGGENVQKLKTSWGGSLNLLSTHRADKFKETDWEEYRHLVSNPVKDELDFTEDSIQKLHKVTNGNPFFTKLLCRVIQKQACNFHNSFTSNVEVNQSINEAVLNDIQMDHFQHFIKDGLIGEESKTEELQQIRAKFLFVVSKNISDRTNISISTIKKLLIKSDLNVDKFDDVLYEFQERDIVTVENENITFNMPLFAQFLKSRGEIELPRFFRADEEYKKRQEIDERLRVKSDELTGLATKWGVYRGRIIEPVTINDWISQFGDLQTRRDVFDFLSNLRFITRNQIIEELKYAFQLAVKNVVFEKRPKQRKRDDVFISYLDGPGKSGAWVANQFKEVNGILKGNLIELEKLNRIARELENRDRNMKVLVLVDDFAGTGNSLGEHLDDNQDMLKNLQSKSIERILLFVAYGFEEARDKILKKVAELNLGIEIHFGQTFKENERIFSNTSRYFAKKETRDKMKAILVEYFGSKVDRNNPGGYNDSEVAIVFPENCPNNSLPILWKSTRSWQPLFPRIVG